jgi:hypothetical protein
MAFMRIFWLTLMVVLLPLRGWTGDAMATGMAGEQAQITFHAAAHAKDTHEEDHAHHGQAIQTSPECAGHGSEAGTQADGVCESCSACHACHALALLVPANLLAPLPAGSTPASTGADRFASADAAPGQKPPIS